MRGYIALMVLFLIAAVWAVTDMIFNGKDLLVVLFGMAMILSLTTTPRRNSDW